MIKRRRRAIPIAATVSVLGLTLGVGLSASASAVPKFTVVASGFDNPRGLAIGDEGKIFVAEGGKGGPNCLGAGQDALCPGLTSAISVITGGGRHHRIVSGFASLSGPGGTGATGLDGVSLTKDGTLYGIITSCPQQVGQVPPGAFPDPLVDAFLAQVGQEIKVTGHDKYRTVAPVGKVDWQWAQDHVSLVPDQFPDCNPYGILAQNRGSQWVVDAASNTIDHVENGNVDVEKFVPKPQSSDAVPTCIAQGPDGALYISQLDGVGNPAGSANVWRFDPNTEDLDVWASGLTAVTGCGFGPDGQFYATEFSEQPFENFVPMTGAVVRVPPHSTSPVVVADGLSYPNGFASSGDAIYVSNWSVCTATAAAHGPCTGHVGQVVKISVGDDD